MLLFLKMSVVIGLTLFKSMDHIILLLENFFDLHFSILIVLATLQHDLYFSVPLLLPAIGTE